MSERKDIFWRAYLIYFGFAILLLIGLIKTFAIQLEGASDVFMSSNDGEVRMPTREVERMPRRGQILDANYTPLVTSVSFYNIHMDPTVVKQELFNKELSNLSIALNELYPEKTAREYERTIRKGRADSSKYVLIHRKATNEERKKLREMPIFDQGRLKGGLIDNDEIIIRKRPHGELMKRTLGYVREQADGTMKKVGIEGAFDEFLAGEPGLQIEQKIATGWKNMGPVVKDPIEGANVVTTIDKEIQEVAHAELMNQLEHQGAKNGCVIVMDVKTGYVKAIVNLSRTSEGEYVEAYNHAIGTKEVPGSTFKLASLMALLEDGKVRISDKVNAAGVYRFYDSKLEDSNYGYGYGEISIQKAFEKSSNVMAKVVNDAYRYEPQKYVNRLKSFGLSQDLGISLTGEPRPTLYEPNTSNWSGISLPWMSIGYEVQQTPLQTLALYNAVANNGTLVRPQFVKEIRRGNDVVETFPPHVLREKICSDRTLKDVRTCLEGVVERGTGKDLQSAFFKIAGKTGTAVILNDDLRYGENGEKKYQASFAGYFPADDPIYSCIVVVSAPTNDIYGAVVSGTVFNAIANKVYASSLQYHEPINNGRLQDAGIPLVKVGMRTEVQNLLKKLGLRNSATTDKQFIVARHEEDELVLEHRFVGKKTVPNVVGMTAKDAVYAIEATGMSVRVTGYGKVVKQSIRPGLNAAPGLTIEIILE